MFSSLNIKYVLLQPGSLGRVAKQASHNFTYNLFIYTLFYILLLFVGGFIFWSLFKENVKAKIIPEAQFWKIDEKNQIINKFQLWVD